VNYDVEADWQLLNTCNYRCDYCFFSEETLGEKLRVFADPDEWAAAFETTGLRWLLHMTGGEPSAYPGFVDLCERLSRHHLLSINSNMTNRSWEDFAKRVAPKRVSFINAGLHFVERAQRNGNAAYLRHVRLLREAGFHVMASLVATPEALSRFQDAIDLLAPIGMFPIPKLLRDHALGGKWYPSAYTAAERKMFRGYADAARRFYKPALIERSEPPTLNMFDDDAELHGTPNYRGISCGAGRLFFKIEPNGDVVRCGPSRSYGNLLKGTFFRETHSSPCDSNYCFYFCEKYSEKQPPMRALYRSLRAVGREVRDIVLLK
jgi:MoaA/NifB/PqqE/SkfB family radical SAM enzyme